jgi:type I restriction-modification system DNA methylase subunit
MDKEKAKAELKILLDRYNNMKLEKDTDVKAKEEEKTKTKLIRPLFEKVLGWKFEEEVTTEERISKGWVDYGFRINDVPKFYLEAKSLKENLDNERYFRQAVSYAYYKGCTWAVLTNFETIKILNAEWEAPMYLNSHFMTINCQDFLERFDDLWLLSREGFEQGLLDTLAEKFGKKTKKSPLTRQLMEDFTRLRTILSKNVIKENQNKKITEDELDESVQKILNRLIFIRNCEDRGLEEKKLWEARNDARVWKTVKETFRYYDTHYDSKLFTYDLTDPKKLHLCDTFNIDDLVVREVIDGLYHTQDKSVSYDFSLIPADVLGTVYEQYLSHILKKTTQRASVAENNVHKKQQGIYYTPIPVVDYIVRNTLGEVLKQNKIDAEKIKLLDISCGSGSFLIKAFDVLDEHYFETEKHQTKFDLKDDTLFKRKVMVLRNNIFGVDLDKQAVEIAQLNLLLKIAEKAQRLPVLEQNIKCGNSLVDDAEVAGCKAFNWTENFGEILEDGGFDLIIGNPPYERSQHLENEKDYYSKNYVSAFGAYVCLGGSNHSSKTHWGNQRVSVA